MRFDRVGTTPLLLLATLVAVPAVAQQPLSEPIEVEPVDDDRSAIVHFLERDDVNRVARTFRIDTERLAARVDEMSPGEQSRVASKARDLEERSAAADTVTLSTTTIIIGLLVLILLILIL